MLLALIAGLLVSVVLASIVGPVWIPPRTVWKVALHEATGFLRPDWSAAEPQIVWQIRFPGCFWRRWWERASPWWGRPCGGGA